MTRALADTTVVDGSKWCLRCGRSKPLAEFATRSSGRPRSWCRTCNRLAQSGSYARQSPGAKERSREQKERYRAANRDRVREWHLAWQRTPIGRIKNRLYVVRYWLRRKPTDTLRETEAFLLAEIARLEGE